VSSSGPGAFTLHCHEVTVRFLEKAVVPPYEGSMIRGAFGRAFKESCCPFPHEGAGCPLGERCPYGYVFETSPPEDARDFAGNQEVPRPYVFEPPEDTKMEYAPGEEMRFGFTVVGRAVDYMPYFVYAFSKMGDEGVGRLRARYELEKIEAKNPLAGTREEVFDGEVVKNRRLPVAWKDAVAAARGLDGECVRLEFLTPTFVRFRGRSPLRPRRSRHWCSRSSSVSRCSPPYTAGRSGGRISRRWSGGLERSRSCGTGPPGPPFAGTPRSERGPKRSKGSSGWQSTPGR
jgi:hypothetical protein